ncbi:hypothetical protein AB0C15_32210 [Micromonospora sp. NPDC048835]|uniref:hypothetical protein n=1 Tax=Micromonospora sp. NPDC048835 TaxID=3155147 RepID=UPI0033D378CF
MSDRIRGKVAHLIDERTLVINRGTDHGVTVGMRFAVLNPKGADVVDPDTGETIGSVDIDKVLVKVVRVAPKMAVARTFRTFVSGIGAIMSSEKRHETLSVEGSTYKQDLEEKDSYVKIGDPVVEARGEEFTDK